MRNYRNLAAIADDKNVLKNPHKGWYIHYVDNGFSHPFYRDSIPEGSHLEDIPGLHHLYLRLEWSDLEPTEGHADFSKVDEIIREWKPYGFKFAFRVCTCVPNSYAETTIPKWVFEAGAKGQYEERTNLFNGKPERCWLPDYNDPVYLEKLEGFMRQYGERFNGDPDVEFIDVGTYGRYGEGHASGYEATPEVVRHHMELHTHYFPDTRIMVNDDMIRQFGNDAALDWAELCRGLDMGLRDDSALVAGPSKQFGYDTLRQPELFDRFAMEAPVDLEFAHRRFVPEEYERGGLTYLEALRRTHATYAGFQGPVYDWYRKYPYIHDRAANLLGYWYFIDGMELPEIRAGERGCMALHISNRGFARAYHDYTLRVRIGDCDAAEIPAANRAWLPDTVTRVPVPLKIQKLAAGTYPIYVGLFEGDVPVRFAVKSEYQMSDGYARIGELEIGESTVR